jgi:hypothetical protein
MRRHRRNGGSSGPTRSFVSSTLWHGRVRSKIREGLAGGPCGQATGGRVELPWPQVTPRAGWRRLVSAATLVWFDLGADGRGRGGLISVVNHMRWEGAQRPFSSTDATFPVAQRCASPIRSGESRMWQLRSIGVVKRRRLAAPPFNQLEGQAMTANQALRPDRLWRKNVVSLRKTHPVSGSVCR